MNTYLVRRHNAPNVTITAEGFSAHGPTLLFYRYDGENDPANGVYSQAVNTHMYKMDDVVDVVMVDEPVAI
ncbi:MAG: hypothetical protein ACRC6V_19235 [Bacteroidales bacterium]